MKLTVVLPALNEEEAIAGSIERCLAARERIIGETFISRVDIVVVSDGSTDRTAEIARGYADVETIVLERNRGYGAAIKAGWRSHPADFLAFLDADGTCDPEYLVPMCRLHQERHADVVIGSRMGPQSEMPKLRRLGNFLFAFLLGLLSKTKLSDCASGMRVVRSSSLHRLLPLPNGLHFTPAMSARALMDDDLEILEVPMPYGERIGRSKLSVLRDGIRFLRAILSAVAFLKPSRLTIPLVLLLLAACAVVSFLPLRYYLAHGVVLEWMVYRFILVFTFGTVATTIFFATVIAEHTIALSSFRYALFVRNSRPWWGAAAVPVVLGVALCLCLLSVILIWPGVVSTIETAEVRAEAMHWSRAMAAAFCAVNAIQALATALLLKILSGLNERQRFLLSEDGRGIDAGPRTEPQ